MSVPEGRRAAYPERVTVALPPGTVERIDRAAMAEHRSRGEYNRRALLRSLRVRGTRRTATARAACTVRKERGGEVRYGSRGSLSVNRHNATFYDHEAGTGGGVLDLIEHRTGQHGPGWLADHNIGDSRRGGAERPRHGRKRRKRAVPPPASVAAPERPMDLRGIHGRLRHRGRVR